MERMTIASYAENAGTATRAITANVAERCNGNSETATKLKEPYKIIVTGDSEAELSFDGVADVILNLRNKKSESAECDGQGNNISETYATKKELAEYAKIEAVAGVCVSRKEISEYISKNEMYIEKFNGVPFLFLKIDGKKYKFSGVEV